MLDTTQKIHKSKFCATSNATRHLQSSTHMDTRAHWRHFYPKYKPFMYLPPIKRQRHVTTQNYGYNQRKQNMTHSSLTTLGYKDQEHQRLLTNYSAASLSSRQRQTEKTNLPAENQDSSAEDFSRRHIFTQMKHSSHLQFTSHHSGHYWHCHRIPTISLPI